MWLNRSASVLAIKFTPQNFSFSRSPIKLFHPIFAI